MHKNAIVVFFVFFFACVLSTPSNLQPLRRFRVGGLVEEDTGDDCSNWNGLDACQGSQTDEPADKDNRRWQTTPQGAPYWNETYQDYHSLVGYAQVVYGSLHKTAQVTVITTTRDPSVVLTYSYNGAAPTTDNTFSVDSSFDVPLFIKVIGSDGSTLQLEEIFFLWQNEDIKDVPQFKSGQKGAIVELFGWPYDDVAAECEALGKMGYMGVKVYPPQESVISFDQLQSNELNPWWFIYQPTSYRLHGRAGTREQLRKMIQTCRSFGVRVYADAVVNHMSGNGNDVGTHRTANGGYCAYWGAKNSTGGSPYFTQGFAYENNTYTGNHPGQEFPSVPYAPTDFHCERSLSSWSDPFALNYGWLSGLCDLNTEKPYVQQRIADYFTDLLGIGFSGFRLDAAKHIQPDDLAAIFAKMKANLGGNIPDDFMTFLEVLLGGEKDLLMCQYSYYQYSNYFVDAMTKAGLSSTDIDKIKIWSSDYPKEFPICGYWIIPAERLVVENDCVDDQKPGSSSRDMGDKGSVLVIEKNVDKHRNFEVQLFTRTDGSWTHKLVLSSYTLRPNTQGNDGWPDGLSDCSRCQGPYCSQCVGVAYQKAHDPNTCGYTVYDSTGNWGSGYYTRVHRDRSIIMAMRGWIGLPTDVSNKDLGLPDACQ